MTSPQMDLLDSLAAYDQPLAQAAYEFGVAPDPTHLAHAAHARTMQIRDGSIALLRGPQLETAVAVALWELRVILAAWDNWFPPDSEPPRFWLRITPQGIAYFEGP